MGEESEETKEDQPSAEEEESVLSEVLQGDFHEGKTTWKGTVSNILVGLSPGVGQVADARDTVAAIKNVWNDPLSGGNWGALGLAVVGWVPGIGDAIKGLGKAGREVATEITDKAVKATDEITKGTTEALSGRSSKLEIDSETRELLEGSQSPSDIDIGPFEDPSRESNAIKRGREGELLKYEDYLRKGGLSEEQIKKVT